MGGVKIQKFLGEAPKISPELLPDTCAQIASNIKTYSGDLLPYNQSSVSASIGVSGTLMALFPLVKPDTSFTWLQWNTDADVVRNPNYDSSATQRVYYTTSANEPRVTNYALATTSGTVFNNTPQAYYSIGLPTPQTAPSAAAVSFTTITGATATRDSGNTVTCTVGSTSTMTSGMYVTITGFTDTSYNVTNTQVTVTSGTTFTYWAVGAAGSATGTGTINIAGTTIPRAYVYTWLTAWGEESIPSAPSSSIYLKEGQQTSITSLPTSWPAYTGTYQTTGMQMNIYRTVVSSSGTNYFKCGTVNLVSSSTNRSRTSNVATITTSVAHGYTVGSVVVVAGLGGTGYNGTQTITAVTSTTFSYSNTGSNEGTTADTAGTVTISTWVDTTPLSQCVTILPSLYWDQPNSGMQGIIAIHNNMLIGFFGNTVCFSEPGFPHAWPQKYRITLTDTIVGLGNVGSYIVVLTDGNPWVIQGNSPAAMTKIRMDYPLPCTSKRSIVNMGYGLCFASRGGIGVYMLAAGGAQLTKNVYSWDNFRSSVDPTTIIAKLYNDKYFAMHSQGSFIFERDDQVGGYLVEDNYTATALYYDRNTAKLYFGANGSVNLWDDATQPFTTFYWKSKVIVTKDYMNLGAARVIADFSSNPADAAAAAQNAIQLVANTGYIANAKTGGAFGSQGTYAVVSGTSTGIAPRVGNTFGQQLFGGSWIKPMLSVGAGVTFQFYVKKQLIYSTQIASDAIFRLPTGYRSDTFEIGVSGNVRVRAIHLAETPVGLKQV